MVDKNGIEQDPHPDFVNGFNEGYFLAQEMPQFANDMVKFLPESERGNGFGRGLEHYNLEMERNRQREVAKEFIRNNRDIEIGKNEVKNIKTEFKESKEDMNVAPIDRITEWLNDKDTNKLDMGLNIEPVRDANDKEPELD